MRLQHDWLRVNKAAITSEVVISAASTNVHDLGVAIRNKTSTHGHGHGWGGAGRPPAEWELQSLQCSINGSLRRTPRIITLSSPL